MSFLQPRHLSLLGVGTVLVGIAAFLASLVLYLVGGSGASDDVVQDLTDAVDTVVDGTPADCRTLAAACVYGVDVSHYQGDVAWDRVAAGHATLSDAPDTLATPDSVRIRFAYVKATEGATAADTTFARNWSGAAAAGLARGAYHVLTLDAADAPAQAAHFVATVRSAAPSAGSSGAELGASGDLPPALDVESSFANADLRGSVTLDSLRARVLQWMDAVHSALGVRPVLYSSDDFLRSTLDGTGLTVRYPVWVANYGAPPAASEPWYAWQFSAHGAVPGIDGAVDLDVLNGPLPD